MSEPVTIAVLAKEPVAGMSKTRLSPPATLDEAAELAEAMLRDTLDAVRRTPGVRRLLVLKGRTGRWLPGGFDVAAQRGDSHAERIAAALKDAGGPVLLIGMDTPQVTPELLVGAVERLASGPDAVIGPATDGGWWVVGFARPRPEAVRDVPTSRPDTYRLQLQRFDDLGLSWETLPELTDVDDFASARTVAAQAPDSRFAALLARVEAVGR